MTLSSGVSPGQRRMLQRFAHESSEAIGKEFGWARWGTKPGESVEELRDLERRGLIHVREEWKDNWVKLTDAGWAVLSG